MRATFALTENNGMLFRAFEFCLVKPSSYRRSRIEVAIEMLIILCLESKYNFLFTFPQIKCDSNF